MTHLPDENKGGERSKTKDEREYASRPVAMGSEVSEYAVWSVFLKET
jgi:hypothetical protein